MAGTTQPMAMSSSGVFGDDLTSPKATSRVGSPQKGPKVSMKAATDMTIRRLPREGPGPGKGRMYVFDRAEWAQFHELNPSVGGPDDPPAGLRRPSKAESQADARSEKASKKSRSKAGSSKRSGSEESHTPCSAFDMKEKHEKPRLTQEERKREEIMSKLSKVETQRQRDLKDMQEVVEKRHDRRADRFKRLLENVTGRDNLAYRTAMALRERQDHEDKRRRELHTNWDEQVYQPIAMQAYEHMNPPNRAITQMLHGSKNVGFTLPDSKKTLIANVNGDPNRKPVVEMAQENAFHQVASAVLGRSASAPDMHTMAGHVVPRARSRPTMEPALWGQQQLQGTLHGHFAQIAEYGANFKRSMRGGTNVHIPDESDGVEAVGKRNTRAFGRNDLGILKGDSASRGVTSTFKSEWGSGHGAPAQDHFTYEQGSRVTDIEFPLGKRMWPEFH